MLRVLGSRWFLTGIGAALICVLLWLLGPLWSVLESLWVLIALTVLVVAIWAGLNLFADWRRRGRDKALVDGIAAPDPSAQAGQEEVAKLRDRLTKAMEILRKASGKRGFLYEQPWYVIIGPPGAGKTTALKNANLTFPLAGETGEIEVAGSGGTRLCEWYFTDTAVLIDTAGRYTTQESDTAVDRAGWEGFLDLLRRARPRQPLNGVIVAIAIDDLLSGGEHRKTHAAAIRRRLKELNERLGVRLPVYVMFTKADLVAGFTEYFDDLDRERRGQVWGVTFPVAGPSGGPAQGFAAELRGLVDVLAARVPDRLQEERGPDRRPAILGFPAQVASLEAPLSEFLDEAFGARQLDPAGFLRGCYFVSGTQFGTPIDRMVGAMARTFGIDQARLPSLKPERGRSYFLEHLIKSVILGEAMLIDRHPGVQRRRMILQVATWSIAGLLLVVGSAALLVSWQRNTAAISRFDAAVASWRGQAERTPLSPVAAADLHRVLPLLDDARALPFGRDTHDSSGWGLGMNQDDTLHDSAQLLYRQALERIMLPRLFWRAEQRMRENLNAADRLYEHTRIYLMLGSRGPMDAGMVHDWAALDWERSLYPGAANKPLRDALLKHLDVLLAGTLPALKVDDGLVEDARAVFSNTPLAVRVYSVLRMAESRAKPWAPAEASGAGTSRWFVRRSGTPLTEEMPGLFTPDGFWTSVLPGLHGAITRVTKERWVLDGGAASNLTDPRAMSGLETAVIALYTREYIQRWEAILNDLDLITPATAQQAVADLLILSTPDSPMRRMLTAITKNLSLAPPAVPTPPASGVVGQAVQALRDGGGIARFVAPDLEPPGKAVDQHFSELREFSGAGLDSVLRTLDELRRLLESQATGVPPPTSGNPVATLQTMRIPMPVKRWVGVIAAGGRSLGSDLQRRAVAAAYGGGGGGGGGGAAPAAGGGAPATPPGPLCKALERRYPLLADGADTSIEDFSRLFGPGGAMDQFFSSQLRPFVAVQGTAWRPQQYMGTEPPVTAADVAVFQRIDRIRNAFFTFGQTPRVTFLIRPVSADAETKKATMDLGGLPITYQSDQPQPPKMFEWPGPSGMTNTQVTFDPPAGAGSPNFATGPWALFRLFAKARRTGTEEQFTITFSQGTRQVAFEVQGGSNNPFSPALFANFRCPAIGP